MSPYSVVTLPVYAVAHFLCLIFCSCSDSDGNRTRVTAVKGRCLNRLTMEPQYLFSYEKTPRVGLEPTTTRLTAECSTIELSRIIKLKNDVRLKSGNVIVKGTYLQNFIQIAFRVALVKPSTD